MEMELNNAFGKERVGFVTERKGWLFSTPISEKPDNEPVKEEFIMVKDRGYQTYVIRRWRTDINEPLRYETFPGWIDIELSEVVVQKENIKKILTKEAKGLLSDEETNEFVEIIVVAVENYRALIENILKNEFPPGLTESPHSLTAFLSLHQDRDFRETIIYSINHLFPEKKILLGEFLERFCEELTIVKVMRRFKIVRTG